ncbi:hypothetical protein SCLCIDRAFT_27124 [Scleroderma citrinum Foug A]|uniref:Uncharacterized protein n=1 Tax=Scleroderma citrinum Foug A TaxID=1036808 RepID=A0A0C3DGA1_9AGAM|nr:hypothetical protein SCLCIDRAFT_27124 [Scleroderma citrinum Foug A]
MVDAYVRDKWLARSSVAIGYTLLSWYEYFLTIEDEVEYLELAPDSGEGCLFVESLWTLLFDQTIVGMNTIGLFDGAWEHICVVYVIFIGIYLLFSLESAL